MHANSQQVLLTAKAEKSTSCCLTLARLVERQISPRPISLTFCGDGEERRIVRPTGSGVCGSLTTERAGNLNSSRCSYIAPCQYLIHSNHIPDRLIVQAVRIQRLLY